MDYIIKDGCAYTHEEIVTETQTAIVDTYYDEQYNTVLTTDKSTIKADGIDTATITATIYDCLNAPQTQSINVVFDVNGIQQTVKATNGVASITINSAITGTYKIKTAVIGYRNGEVEVTAQ